MKEAINIVCIKWGEAYDEKYVNTLYNMIKRETSYLVNFHCFTDNDTGLDEEIIALPLPNINEKEYKNYYSYRKEVGLCDDNLGGLQGQRVFFFDLDVVIISNLDELFAYPREDMFYIINDWNSKGEKVGQASCYSWVVGSLGYVKKYFEENAKEVYETFKSAPQEYLSSKVIEKHKKLNFWPDEWFCSFRFHCLCKIGVLRHFIGAKIPKNKKDLKVIVFHGNPNPREAMRGYWHLDKGQGWKRLYKVCKPVNWIKEYWY